MSYPGFPSTKAKSNMPVYRPSNPRMKSNMPDYGPQARAQSEELKKSLIPGLKKAFPSWKTPNAGNRQKRNRWAKNAVTKGSPTRDGSRPTGMTSRMKYPSKASRKSSGY